MNFKDYLNSEEHKRQQQEYNDYVIDFCKSYLPDPDEFDFYDLAEHDLYIWTISGEVYLVEDFY